jgi:hypothetical protein
MVTGGLAATDTVTIMDTVMATIMVTVQGIVQDTMPAAEMPITVPPPIQIGRGPPIMYITTGYRE